MYKRQTRDLLATIFIPLICLLIPLLVHHLSLNYAENYALYSPFFLCLRFIYPLLFGLMLARLVLVDASLYPDSNYLCLVVLLFLANFGLLLLPLLFFGVSLFARFAQGFVLFYSLTSDALFALSQPVGLLSGVFLLQVIRCISTRRKKSKTAVLDGAVASDIPSA